MHMARHYFSYPPWEEECTSVQLRGSYFWSVNESSWISLVNMNRNILAYVESHLFNQSTSCQNQMSNNRVIKVYVLKSLTFILPQEVHCHSVTCLHLMFVTLKASFWQQNISFPPDLMHPCSFRHVGTPIRPLLQKNISFLIWTCLCSSCLCFSLSSSDRLLME